MSYKARTLFGLIEEMNVSLFLPHIQRPFVWDEDQMSRLFDSLMRDYPIQTFLLWRTREQIKARKFMQCIEWDAVLSDYYDFAKSSAGVEKVFVLDGQQRLQTLYAVFSGAVEGSDSTTPQEAYFDITAGHVPNEEGLLYPLIFSSERLPLPRYRLRDLLERHNQKNPLDIAKEINKELDSLFPGSGSEIEERRDRVLRNCIQLVSLLREERYFWVDVLDGVANDFPYRRVLDIFVRVNSGGTKLNAADLMFAAMKEGWSDIEENVEEVVEMLNSDRLCFDKSVVLKCIVVALGYGAILDPQMFASATGEKLLEETKQNWSRIESTFNQLRDFITNDLKLYADKVVRSYNSFVPLFDYLYHNPGPGPYEIRLMTGYYYKSQMFNWFGRQTDGIMLVCVLLKATTQGRLGVAAGRVLGHTTVVEMNGS